MHVSLLNQENEMLLKELKAYHEENEKTAVYRVLQESASHSHNISKLYLISKGILFEQLFLIDYFNLSGIYKRDCIANFMNQKNVILYQILAGQEFEFNSYNYLITKKNKKIIKLSHLLLGRLMIKVLLKILNYHL